jgi:hypothetical protein
MRKATVCYLNAHFELSPLMKQTKLFVFVNRNNGNYHCLLYSPMMGGLGLFTGGPSYSAW